MACLFGHKLENGKCVRCGSAMISGVLTPEETEKTIGFLETYQLLYGRLALEGTGADKNFGSDASHMFATLKAFFEASDKTYDKTAWKTVLDGLAGFQNALPEVLSEGIKPITSKIEQYVKSSPR